MALLLDLRVELEDVANRVGREPVDDELQALGEEAVVDVLDLAFEREQALLARQYSTICSICSSGSGSLLMKFLRMTLITFFTSLSGKWIRIAAKLPPQTTAAAGGCTKSFSAAIPPACVIDQSSRPMPST